ncbi:MULTISPECIES: kelch repeat-containing protein [unclassified Streptomyces]|uniref:Kelch repeat-containing protein n=1 Tax=unclassified Streptomyces TaxID=2593676 RepID=UPI001E3DC47D|nr:kelch repeat-containing protein [Streptomyces sp. CB02980]MCB8906969.1 Kelch-like protein 17 [Streptomyces sp. CB02980]
MRTLLADGGEHPGQAGPPSVARRQPSGLETPWGRGTPSGREAPSGRWAPAGEPPLRLVMMHGQQDGPVRLPDGRVLFAGGAGPHLRTLDATALFHPADTRWTGTAPLRRARRMHTLTPLADGRVLAAGGITGPQAYPPPALATAEIYDPAHETWTPTGELHEARHSHTAVRLPDGRVLVAGGQRPRDTRAQRTLASAELYDPDTGAWTPTREMGDARWHHQAVLLTDGRVLVAGGLTDIGRSRSRTLGLCELYDPTAGTWTPTGALRDARCAHQALVLLDGTVLTVGGFGPSAAGDDGRYDPYGLAGVERYDPAAEVWSPEPSLPWGRGHHRAVLLGTGEVLVCGGADHACQDVGYAGALRYDPGMRSWSVAGPMDTGRWAFGAVLLDDGRVLAAGGVARMGAAAPALGADVPAATAEVFTP